ncbi:MAG: hypothetical protein MR536_00535 [Prevotella sp.]|nr:hypothetical protein [Prevotella sp.]
MKKNYVLMVMLFILAALTSCQQDESINTSQLNGDWFVNRIETTDASSLDDEDYTTSNSRIYDSYKLQNGALMTTIRETSDFNKYFVVLYKHNGNNWEKVTQEHVTLDSKNKFDFYDCSCKFKSVRENELQVKTRVGNTILRYRLERTAIKP